jgi:hypothetical protein
MSSDKKIRLPLSLIEKNINTKAIDRKKPAYIGNNLVFQKL